MNLPVRIARVDEDRPLLELLPELPDDERFAFVRDGEGVVGWGVAARIGVGTGPERFRRAREGLATTLHEGCVGATDAPRPLAFASFTFDPDEDGSVMVVPAVAVVRQGGGATWRIEVGDGVDLPAGSAERRSADAAADRPRYGGSTVRDDVWLESVARALEEIGTGSFAKVVLARDLHLWSRAPFDVPAVLAALAARFPSCATFLVDHLIGASPEPLVRRTGTAVASRVLAGTAPRGSDASEDNAIGAGLLASAKDRHEHELAVVSAVEALRDMCVELSVPPGPSLVQLDNVQHLGSDLTGTLAARDDGTAPHILDLVARLHPTAAVGGAPRDAAMAAIRELEGMSRGRYAGPVGWCTADGDGEFAIALRCAEARGDRARLFAGAGIVKGSTPVAELLETWLKLRAILGVLANRSG